mmetsp:Transcript_20993/g.65938  ORF Transcript_20993/g.65938 Transcript_20993/m.65938 type:complete len:285 (-) Transcript_20993:20-874(-)
MWTWPVWTQQEHQVPVGSSREPRHCAISFSWCGNAKSTPPACKSNVSPNAARVIAEHSMCQPGRPAPHGDSQLGSPAFAPFHSAKSRASRFPESGSSTRSAAAALVPRPSAKVPYKAPSFPTSNHTEPPEAYAKPRASISRTKSTISSTCSDTRKTRLGASHPSRAIASKKAASSSRAKASGATPSSAARAIILSSMSVTPMAYSTSHPPYRRALRTSMSSVTYVRAWPTWAASYTVGPHAYHRSRFPAACDTRAPDAESRIANDASSDDVVVVTLLRTALLAA